LEAGYVLTTTDRDTWAHDSKKYPLDLKQLEGAKLNNAKMAGVKLSGAHLEGVCMDDCEFPLMPPPPQRAPPAESPSWLTMKVATHVMCGLLRELGCKGEDGGEQEPEELDVEQGKVSAGESAAQDEEDLLGEWGDVCANLLSQVTSLLAIVLTAQNRIMRSFAAIEDQITDLAQLSKGLQPMLTKFKNRSPPRPTTAEVRAALSKALTGELKNWMDTMEKETRDALATLKEDLAEPSKVQTDADCFSLLFGDVIADLAFPRLAEQARDALTKKAGPLIDKLADKLAISVMAGSKLIEGQNIELID
jgi:hypothetical protein